MGECKSDVQSGTNAPLFDTIVLLIDGIQNFTEILTLIGRIP